MKNRRTWLLALGASMLLTVTARGMPTADPMRPSYVKPSGPSRVSGDRRPAAYRLQAIIGTAGDRIAVVNGRVLRIGDPVGSARLRRIGDSFVELQDRRRRWLLRLPTAPLN